MFIWLASSCVPVITSVATIYAVCTDDIDPRDLKRLQVDLHHALKFIRHNRGNFNNAFNHMVIRYCHTTLESLWFMNELSNS